MKRLVLITIIMTNCILLYAQSFCHNEDYNYPNLLEGMNESFVNYTGPYHIRVYFHIIRQSDGTGEYSVPSLYIPLCMQVLNNDYNSHNIFFDYAGMDYINNSNYYFMSSLSSSYYNSLINTNSHTNAMDVYLLPTNGSLGGRASGIPGSALVVGGTMDNVEMGISHVLSHEMGHCLGLFHTFHGGIAESSGGCAELVNGSNCTLCGDYVCDTPADPFPLFSYVDSECTWVNYSYTDGNGQLYHPDTKQIMAYVSPLCMEHFSAGQGERMRVHIATQPMLQNRMTPAVTYVQNQQFYGGGEELITANDSVIAGNNVTSGQPGNVIVSSNATITFEAGKAIVLKLGFKVNNGGQFHARINTISNPDNIVRITNDMNDVVYGTEPFIEITNISPSATKILRNGQLFIRRGDKTYTAAGLEIK